jgi:hypothetical protein
MSFLLLLAVWIAGGAPVGAQPVAAPDTSAYVWDAACKDCHTAVHAAWARTKHATAINRLSVAERQQECVGCHVTGAPTLLGDEAGKPQNAGVQCESCHGPGRQHAETAASGSPAPLPAKPDQKLCETCHSSRSPHFRGFFYAAMAPLVHRVR